MRRNEKIRKRILCVLREWYKIIELYIHIDNIFTQKFCYFARHFRHCLHNSVVDNCNYCSCQYFLEPYLQKSWDPGIWIPTYHMGQEEKLGFWEEKYGFVGREIGFLGREIGFLGREIRVCRKRNRVFGKRNMGLQEEK